MFYTGIGPPYCYPYMLRVHGGQIAPLTNRSFKLDGRQYGATGGRNIISFNLIFEVWEKFVECILNVGCQKAKTLSKVFIHSFKHSPFAGH